MPGSVSLPAWEIATRLDQAFNVPSHWKCGAARDQLIPLRFDQAPVMKEGRLIGWVRTSHLVSRGFVEERTTLLDRCTVLARDTSVGDAIKALGEDTLIFLAGATGITEFAVTSDLDRHAVRCYLYVLVSELEMLMAQVAARDLSEEQIVGHMTNERKRYRRAQAEGVETHPVEYLNFSAYKTLVFEVPAIVEAFPADIENLEVDLERLKNLRDCVAHPAKSLTLEFTPAEIAGLTRFTEAAVASLRASESVSN